MCKREKFVYDISFIRHFVAFTPSWQSTQARRALNPFYKNASYKTRIIIYYFIIRNLNINFKFFWTTDKNYHVPFLFHI
jgi:hypothetical protein